VGNTHLASQWILGILTPSVKQQECKADKSCPYNAKFKNAWSYTTAPAYVFMACTRKLFSVGGGGELVQHAPIRNAGDCFADIVCRLLYYHS
jgi:hypothetical protein